MFQITLVHWVSPEIIQIILMNWLSFGQINLMKKK